MHQALKLAGYWDGPVDGQWTDALTDALGKLQEDLGVKVTGTVDAATIAALEEATSGAGGDHAADCHPAAVTVELTSDGTPMPPRSAARPRHVGWSAVFPPS